MYIASVALSLPIAQNQPVLGFTYSQIFKSPYKGFLISLPIAFIGCLIGSVINLFIGRYLLKDCILSWANKKPWFKKHFAAMDEILKENGIKSMAIIRLSVFPFSTSSYLFGITSIKPMDYIIGSCTFSIRLALSIYLGCRLYVMGKKESTTTDRIVFAIEILFNVGFSIMVGVCAKQKM
jgi:uncharacterized membrane protein YdjX (TVP38/TMEM64 family)